MDLKKLTQEKLFSFLVVRRTVAVKVSPCIIVQSSGTISSRVIRVSLCRGHTNLSVIQCYASTNLKLGNFPTKIFFSLRVK